MTLVVQLVRKSEEKAEDLGKQEENLIFQLLSLQGLALSTLKVNIHLWSPVVHLFRGLHPGVENLAEVFLKSCEIIE